MHLAVSEEEKLIPVSLVGELTSVDAEILEKLQKEEYNTVSGLAEELGFDKGTVSRRAKKLKELGLVDVEKEHQYGEAKVKLSDQ